MSNSISSSPDQVPQYPDNPVSCAYAQDPETGGILLPLRGSVANGRQAIIDEGAISLIEDYRWYALVTNRRVARPIYYAYGRHRTTTERVYLHRLIMGVTDKKVCVDHINHNALDNRIANLRLATTQQNVFNRRPEVNTTSKFKGVCWHKHANKWVVAVSGKHIGLFDSEVEAANAADHAFRELYGEFAYTNFGEAI